MGKRSLFSRSLPEHSHLFSRSLPEHSGIVSGIVWFTNQFSASICSQKFSQVQPSFKQNKHFYKICSVLKQIKNQEKIIWCFDDASISEKKIYFIIIYGVGHWTFSIFLAIIYCRKLDWTIWSWQVHQICRNIGRNRNRVLKQAICLEREKAPAY